MPLGVGFLSKAAAADEAAFNEEALVTRMLALVSEKLSDNPRLLRDNTLSGRPQTRQYDQGTIAIGGDVSTRLRYDNANPLFKNWFGQLDSGRYTHLGTTEGQSLTLAIDKGVSVWTYTGCKVAKLVLDFKAELITVIASIIASRLYKNSVVNTPAVMAGLSDPSGNVMFHHLVLRVGEQTAALDESNAIGITDFKLTLDRPLDQIFTNESQFHIEAFERAFPNMMLDLKVPRYQSDMWHDWKTSKTRLQLDFSFSDGVRTKTIVLPNIELDDSMSSVAGPAALTIDVKAVISEAEDTLTATSISTEAGDNSLNFGAGNAPYCHPGAVVYVSGFADPDNNGVAAVVSRTASKIVVTGVNDGGIDLLTEGAGTSVTVTTRSPDVYMVED